MSKKDLNLLLVVLGLIAGFCAFYFGYKPMTEKAVVLQADTVALQAEIAKLEELENRKDFFVSESERMAAEIGTTLNKFAVDVLPEDDIRFAYQQDNRSTGDYLFIENMGFTEPTAIYNTNQFTLPEGVDNYLYQTLYLYNGQTSYTMKCTYSSLKDVVKQIFAQKNRRAIDSITMAFDESTGLLQGSLVMNSYYVDGLDRAYVAPDLTPVRQGTDNIFGTVDVADVTETVAP